MKKIIYLYKLTDGKGNQHVVVVDDPSDDGCISGEDAQGQHHQFESNQLYNAYDWATEHGFVLEHGEMEIDIPNGTFKAGYSLANKPREPSAYRCRVCGERVLDTQDQLRDHLEGHSAHARDFSFTEVLNSFVRVER